MPSHPRGDLPAGEIGDTVLSIAGARSLGELGAASLRGIARTVGARAAGLYLLEASRPRLFYSENAPEGLLEEFSGDFYRSDPLLGHVCERGTPADGRTLIGASGWRRSGNFDFLRRWGFSRHMAGPLHAEGRVMGFVYTSMRAPADAFGEAAVERMRLICEAGSLALRTMLETGRLSPAQPAAPCGALPPRALEVASLLRTGRSNKEIARLMRISPHTVKEHVGLLCARFGARNRTELTMRLMQAEGMGTGRAG